MKAEEARRYLEFLGCEALASHPVHRVSRLPTKRYAVLTVVLTSLILVGLVCALFSFRSGLAVEGLPQSEQSVSEHLPISVPPALTEDSLTHFEANGHGATESIEYPQCPCVGAWAPIVAGLLARRGDW